MSTTPRLPVAFNRLAWSNLAAQSAEQIGLAAAPIVAVLTLGAGAGATGVLQTAQTLPFLLMSIPAGLLADRMSRARLMAYAETLRVLALLALLALAALGGRYVSLLAGIVEPPRTRAGGKTSHPLRDLRAGVTFVLGHKLLRPIFVTQLIFNTALFVIQAVYVPYAIQALGLPATGVGVTLAAFGVGMVSGALLAARIMRVLALGTVIAIGPIAGFVAALVMVATIWLPYAPLAALSFFLMGAGPILWVVSTTTLRQA